MGGRSGSASARRARDAPRPIATLALVGKAPRLCVWGLGRRLRSESERVLRKAEASESGRGGQRAGSPRAHHSRVSADSGSILVGPWVVWAFVSRSDGRRFRSDASRTVKCGGGGIGGEDDDVGKGDANVDSAGYVPPRSARVNGAVFGTGGGGLGWQYSVQRALVSTYYAPRP